MDLNALPKIELHCHTEGIIGPDIIRRIRQAHPDFPLAPEDMLPHLPIHNLETFENWWHCVRHIYGQLPLMRLVLAAYMKQAKQQNIRYLEVMLHERHLPADQAEAIDVFTAFREQILALEQGTIQVEFLMMFNRARPAADMEARESLIVAMHDAGLLAGVALAGMEIGYPASKFTQPLRRLHDAGVSIEVHAGEWVGPESVRDALDYGYPDRIGHGVSLFQDERLIERVLEQDIHVEFCPTSNVKTGSIQHITDHPLRRALDLGMNVSLSTDDPGPFEISLTDEYETVAAHFDIHDSDWQTLYDNALRSRFQHNLRITP